MKNRGTAIILALLLGGIGGHRFYLDRPVSGLFYVLFCWTLIPAVIAFFEVISLALMTNEDFNLEYNTPQNQNNHPTKVPGQIILREDPVKLDEKQCPDCAETVKSAARKCRFCGHTFAA